MGCFTNYKQKVILVVLAFIHQNLTILVVDNDYTCNMIIIDIRQMAVCNHYLIFATWQLVHLSTKAHNFNVNK